MTATLFLLLLLALAGPLRAEGTKFSANRTDAGNTVEFVSNAPLEKIVGRVHSVSAEVTLNLSNLKTGASGKVIVPLDEFDTGLERRNDHLRVNHLETDKFPEAVFTLSEIVSADPANLVNGGTASVLLAGVLDLHGVKQEYEILGVLGYDPGARELSVRCQWPLKLADHQIARPDFLFMRLADRQEIFVDITLTR